MLRVRMTVVRVVVSGVRVDVVVKVSGRQRSLLMELVILVMAARLGVHWHCRLLHMRWPCCRHVMLVHHAGAEKTSGRRRSRLDLQMPTREARSNDNLVPVPGRGLLIWQEQLVWDRGWTSNQLCD